LSISKVAAPIIQKSQLKLTIAVSSMWRDTSLISEHLNSLSLGYSFYLDRFMMNNEMAVLFFGFGSDTKLCQNYGLISIGSK